MTKEKYQIPRKADFIGFTILLHDLKCFDEELSSVADGIDSLTKKMRSTRNVFVSLHNLKDLISRIRVSGDLQFTTETRKIRRELDFIAHIRNKGVGHLDSALLERAAQWTPELFYEHSHANPDYLNFLSYKSVLESTINSYINEEGEQKVFNTEIDFLYPPDAKHFFTFLSDIVKRSIAWIESALEVIKPEITLHSHDKIKEIGVIAGQTNFNLKSESEFRYSDRETNEMIESMIGTLREMGVSEEIITRLREI